MNTALTAQRRRPDPAAVGELVERLTDQIDHLKAQLRHAQKLAAIGTNTAMLAHEYNNIVAPVISYAQYALERDDVALMRKTLTMMLQQFESVQAMSDRVLGLAQRSEQSTGPVNLRQLVDNAVACLGRDLSKDHITAVIDIDDTLYVQGRASELQQVLFNLLLNARQAMVGHQGSLLKISATPLSHRQVSIHIRDNGKGIAEAHLERIFDPFFSTKSGEQRHDKKGIGLGLAICKEIISEHDGIIAVESCEGRGTTFTITLPLVPSLPEST